jgi:hypothetical protein
MKPAMGPQVIPAVVHLRVIYIYFLFKKKFLLFYAETRPVPDDPE